MSTSPAVIQPTELKLPSDVRLSEEDSEDNRITNLDQDLTPTEDVESTDSSTEKLLGECKKKTSPLTPASVSSINAEWKRLGTPPDVGLKDTARASSSGAAQVEHLQNQAQAAAASQTLQMRGQKLSEVDLYLQPSQVEELLTQNSIFEHNSKRSSTAATSTAASTSQVPTVHIQPLAASPVRAPPPSSSSSSSRRPSWWDGFKMCLNPVMGYLKNDKKKPPEKKEDCEVPFADIRELNFIGSGSQGAVFAGEYLGEKVAVKKVKDKSYCQEAVHMRKLSHPNVVKFRGVCTHPPCYCVIMEYCPRGTLYDYIRLDMEIPPPQVLCWARQIAVGMFYLHSRKIIHRDLKSLNILISADNTLKISDFGVSRQFGESSTKMTFVGTVAWMAPEMIRHENCSEKVDVWSYGVLLWEILVQEKPYNNINTSAIIWGVGSNNLHLPIPSGCPAGLKILMEMCCLRNLSMLTQELKPGEQPKPKNRPSFRQILLHLDLAAGAFLAIPPDTYQMTQESWREEVEKCLGKLREDGIPNDTVLLSKREEELRHAQDVRVLYEQKLQTAEKLYKDLKSCKNHLEAREMELQRKEKQLNDYAYKVRRGMPSGVPLQLDAHALHSQTSDTSDYQDGGAMLPSPSKQAGSKKDSTKKVWRRKRRQSACKEDKAKDMGFSEKLVNSNRLARRQSLPPLTNMSPALAAPPHQNFGRVEMRDAEVTAPQEMSPDSTPRPSQCHTPITPNGTLSLEVTELIDSVRNSFRHSHRRSGSTGSVEKSLRVKASGTKTASLEASPLRTNLQARLSSHQQQQLSHLTTDRFGAGTLSGHSPVGSISYLDLSSSDEEHPPTPRYQLDDSHKEEGLDTAKDAVADDSAEGRAMGVVTMVAYSNDSSPDTHGSDNEEGNDADAEFTSDGASENVFRGQFSGTEPNDTASPSSQLDSDEPTSQSNVELSDAISENQAHPSNILTDNHGAVVGDVYLETSNYGYSEGSTHQDKDFNSKFNSSRQPICNDPYPLQYPVTDNILTSTSLLSESWYQKQTPIQDSCDGNDPLLAEEGFELEEDTPVLAGKRKVSAVPLHIRSSFSSETRNDDAGSVTPTAPKPQKLNSVTTIIRSFFESASSKPKILQHQQQHSSELEDSGFQSPQAGLV